MGQSPFVAEISVYPYTFAPKGWATCDGQILPLSQNTALFALLGTTYGGDGISNFALPNLGGSVPVCAGQGPGLSLYNLGDTSGAETVTLLQTEMPSHSHAVMASNADATDQTPVTELFAGGIGGVVAFGVPPTTVQMNVNSLTTYGGSGSHNNLMPFLTLMYCIALTGVFPPRT